MIELNNIKEKEDIVLDKAKTCCFSGHRSLKWELNIINLKKEIVNLISKGYNTFLVGMAVGFDSLIFKILEKLRKKTDIKIVACVPCENQERNFSFTEKAEYKKMLKSADKVVLLEQKYTPYCMMKRNRFMVDNSSVLVVYLRQNTGGTYNTFKYAENKNSEIIMV